MRGSLYNANKRKFNNLRTEPYNYKISEKEIKNHFHEIDGLTNQTREHDHDFYSKTIKTVYSGGKHIHYFKISTSIENGHSHKVFGKTGTEIENGNGHVHNYEGITTLDVGHIHFFGDYTSPPIYKSI